MKKRFTIMIAAIIMLLTMLTLPGKVVGQTYSLTPNQSNTGSSATSYVTTLTEFTYSGVKWKMNQWNPSSLQIKTNQSSAANEFRFYNTTAFSGRITQVVLKFQDLTLSNTSNTGFMFVGGTSEVSTTTGGTAGTWNSTAKTITWTPGASDNYTFFAFYQNGKVATGTNKLATADAIVVTYESSGGGGQTTTYTVTYDANGGIGTMIDENSPYDEGSTVTVLNNTFGRCGYDFQNWNTEANASGTDYDEGDEFEINNAITLYAQWTAQTGITIATLTQSNLELTGSYTTNTEKTIDGITYVYTDLMKSTDNIQAKASSGTIKNSTAYSGDIKCVAITHNGDARATTINGSSDGTVWHQVATGSGSIFADFSGKGYKYFQITRGSNAAYWTKIEIAYLTTPSITAENVNIAYGATGGSIGYTINNPSTPEGTLSAAIAQSPTSTIEGLTIGTINASTVAFTCAANNTTTARTATVTLTYTYGNSQTATKDVVITQAAAPTPTISAADVDIAYGATDGSISYSIENGTGSVTAVVTDGDWLTLGMITSSTVPFTCEANADPTARTATVTLSFTGASDKEVTVTQAAAPYSTIPALFAAATGTSKGVVVTFGGWVISGVNGSQAFLTDNQGNGLIIYQSNHGFSVNDVLSGTASCNLVKYNGSAELTGLTSETSGLSVSNNGTITEQNIAINALTGVNTGAVLSYENLKYNGTAFEDTQENGIQPYNTLYSYSTPKTNHYYNVKGVYLQYSSTKEILPRSSADIVLKAQMTAPTFNAFTYVVGNTPTAQTAAIAGTDFSGNLTVTVAEGDYVVSNDGSNYGTSATFTQSNGTISNQTLYVKLNSGLSAGTYNGKLSFTADYLDAFEVNLAGSVTANPTYNVTLTQPAGDIATIASDPTYAQSGATITLSYSDVDACYVFDHWTVIPDVTWVTTNSFTMPGSDVEVSATFNIKHFTVNYSVNGIVYDDLVDDNIECGDDAELWTEEEMAIVGVEPPTGYTLAGWSTSASSSETVSSFTPSEDATLYAVLVPAGATGGYQLITSASDITAGTYLIGAFKSSSAPSPLAYYIVNGTIGSDGMEVTNSSQQTTDGAFSSLPTGGAEISLTGNNTDGFIVSYGSNSLGYTSYANKTIAWGDYDSYLWKFSDKENGLSTGAVYMTCHYNDKDYTVSENGTNSQPIRGYASSTAYRGFYLFKKVEVTPYTLVENITSTIATLPSIEPSYLITVKDGGILTLTGTNNGNASNLIIEDGGQLVISNDVAATVKKDIAKYNNATDKDGWYTIASPVAGANVSLAQLGTYDLFAYDEEHHQWLNVKDQGNSITTFAQGQGFLYANSANQTLPFAGTMKASNATVTVQLSYESADGKLKGFNLVGNPFTCNVTSEMVTMNGEPLTTYYVAEGGSNLVTRNLASTPIKPGRGFFVQAPSECDLVFNPGAKGEMDYKPTFISIEAGNGEFADRAYVQLGYGNTLRKMSINDNTPMVYVMNNDADYAAATVNALKGTMPVCFRAKETGHYTISVATEGLDMSYLHLIDRLTGADIDLLIEPSYSFIATKDDNQSRFILSFTADCFNEDEDEIFAYQNGNEIFVNGEGELQVFDVMGRMVATQRINGVETVNIPTQGVYIMRLNEKTQKIVVR